MSAPWEPFRYGETTRDGRSLGTGLLSVHDPAAAKAIGDFARAAQGVDWPAGWLPAEALASVLLGDGRRLIAVGRYGLRDSTPERRPGAVEMVGLVGSEGLEPEAMMAARVWCRRRLNVAGELPTSIDMAEVLAEAGPVEMPPPRSAPPLTPHGLAIFTAAEHDEPDRRWAQMLPTLPARCQWLPWLGEGFPVADYTARGPLIAFTPNPSPPALHLHMPAAPATMPKPRGRAAFVWVLALGLLGLNAWAWWTVDHRWRRLAAESKTAEVPPVVAPPAGDVPRDALAAVLIGVPPDEARRRDLLRAYDEWAGGRPMRYDEADRLLIGAAVRLAARPSGADVEKAIRSLTESKGFDPGVVELIARRVREKLGN